jgi:ring-1,2-phenylacetyl-CoA epoxidase subunit PaaD
MNGPVGMNGSPMKNHSGTELRLAIDAIRDPELGDVTISDLGLIRSVLVVSKDQVDIEISPTFLGCVAMGIMQLDIESTVIKHGYRTANIRHVHAVWSTNDISVEGLIKLRSMGIVVLRRDEDLTRARCPFCDSTKLERRSHAGSTRCRSVAWCATCRNVVELMESKFSPNPNVESEARNCQGDQEHENVPTESISYVHV